MNHVDYLIKLMFVRNAEKMFRFGMSVYSIVYYEILLVLSSFVVILMFGNKRPLFNVFMGRMSL